MKLYCDDSGTDGGEFCVIAGYLFDDGAVVQFSQSWQSLLNADPAVQYFKMKEAESRRGEFWGFEDAARDQKVMSLAHVVKDHAIYGLGSFVAHRPYNSIARGALPPTVDHPYWLCFQGIIGGLLHLYENGLKLETTDFIFDSQGVGFERRGALMQGGWREMLEKVGGSLIGPLSFGDDKKELPLQAADLLAWHIRRHSNTMATTGHAESRPVADLLWTIPTLTKAWHPDEIDAFVEGYHNLHPQSPRNLGLRDD